MGDIVKLALRLFIFALVASVLLAVTNEVTKGPIEQQKLASKMAALNTVLPYGLDRIAIDRTLTTESLAAFMPFNAQELCDPTGVLYGQNAITRNLVVVDRLAKSSGNGFVLGMTGGGKSFFCKELTCQSCNFTSHHQIALHIWSSKIQISVFQTDFFFCLRILLNLERRCL